MRVRAASPLHTVVTETARRVGKAQACPPSAIEILVLMVGTLRFAHPTKYESGHAFQKRFFRGLHRVGGSDVHPDAVKPEAKQPFLFVGAVEHFR